ncbi:MAG: universal stress protein [Halanaeroarchaeum sp.]
MGTIFVAYGEPGHRNAVLEFALERAAACQDDVLVYHVQETEGESADRIREDVDQVVETTAPEVPVDVHVQTREEVSDLTNVSKQKRLTDAILEADREFAYVVMGDVQRDSLDRLTHASTTEAVLDTHAIPVLLVPV